MLSRREGSPTLTCWQVILMQPRMLLLFILSCINLDKPKAFIVAIRKNLIPCYFIQLRRSKTLIFQVYKLSWMWVAYRFYLQEAFPNWHESLIAELRLETGFHIQYENGAWLVTTNCKKKVHLIVWLWVNHIKACISNSQYLLPFNTLNCDKSVLLYSWN